MKDIFGTIGKYLGLIFMALVVGYTAILTYQVSARLVPDSIMLQLMTVLLFDGASLVWFIKFISQAKGTSQWAICGIGFFIGILGTVIMAAGELILGQRLVVLDNPQQLGWVLIGSTVAACLAHVVLGYMFYFADPATKNRIENAQKVAEAVEHAYTDARKQIEREVDQLTNDLKSSVLDEARQQIGLLTAGHIRNQGKLKDKTHVEMSGGRVIDGESRPVQEQHGGGQPQQPQNAARLPHAAQHPPMNGQQRPRNPAYQTKQNGPRVAQGAATVMISPPGGNGKAADNRQQYENVIDLPTSQTAPVVEVAQRRPRRVHTRRSGATVSAATRKVTRTCAMCGETFAGTRRAKFCCNAHRQAAYRNSKP